MSIRATIVCEFTGRAVTTDAIVVTVVSSPVASPGISDQIVTGITKLLLTHDKGFVIVTTFSHDIALPEDIHINPIKIRSLPDVRTVCD